MFNTKIGAKVAVVSFIKSSIPIAAGADFYAYIPIDIDTTDVIWAFPILTDAPGDNCTKVNISTCVWQDKSKRIYVNGCNLASGTANISLAGVLIAIRYYSGLKINMIFELYSLGCYIRTIKIH